MFSIFLSCSFTCFLFFLKLRQASFYCISCDIQIPVGFVSGFAGAFLCFFIYRHDICSADSADFM